MASIYSAYTHQFNIKKLILAIYYNGNGNIVFIILSDKCFIVYGKALSPCCCLDSSLEDDDSYILLNMVLCFPLFLESKQTGDILLVGELRNLLSDMCSPLTELTSEVLGPSTLNKVTGEK